MHIHKLRTFHFFLKSGADLKQWLLNLHQVNIQLCVTKPHYQVILVQRQSITVTAQLPPQIPLFTRIEFAMSSAPHYRTFVIRQALAPPHYRTLVIWQALAPPHYRTLVIWQASAPPHYRTFVIRQASVTKLFSNRFLNRINQVLGKAALPTRLFRGQPVVKVDYAQVSLLWMHCL